jgi:hypothetical protein
MIGRFWFKMLGGRVVGGGGGVRLYACRLGRCKTDANASS